MEQNSEHVQSQEEVIERIVEQVRAKLKSRLVIGPQTLDSIERQAQDRPQGDSHRGERVNP